MRVLFLIFVFVFTVAAQTSGVIQNFEAGNAAAQQRRYEQAIEKYRTAAIYAENDNSEVSLLAKIHFNIGVCLYQLKRTNEAVAEYLEAIKLSKRQYQRAFYALGIAQKDLENWRAAESALRDALEIDKTDGEAWFDLALVYLKEKDFMTAEQAFENSIRYKSVNSADAHNNLGVIAALKHDWKTAEKEFETALLNSNGKSAEASGNLRFCKFYKQNYSSKDWLAKLEFSRNKKEGE